MAGRRQAFQNNPELQRFMLSGVCPTGRQLGVGSYGSVEELEMNGLVCAGKRLHEALLEQGNAGVAEISRKYLLECQVMAEMRHPHIVQFLGLCFLEGSALPVLVMERLDSSLDDLLETSPGLPLALKQSLLTDVAQGLVYLHTRNPPVVHRDLSARNVLLTSSLVAKISDLGNARIVNLQPGQLARTLTRVPGTLAYMPPESFDQCSQYGPRLDIFSFGHLALFTLTQVFPGALLPYTYPDPDNPGRVCGRSEVERRIDYIQPLQEQLGEQHPLLQLVCQCLHNEPAQRPSAEELLQQFKATRLQIERAYGSKQQAKVEMAKLQEVMMSVFSLRETEVGEKDGEIEQLRHDLQQVQALVEAKDTQLQRQGAELRERTLQLNRQLREVQTLQEERGRLQSEVEAKDAEINRQQRELQTLMSKMSQLQEQAQEKDAEVHRQQRELQTLRAETDSRIAQIQQQLRERDDEVNRLQRELREQNPSRGEGVAVVQSPPQKAQTYPLSELTWRRLPDMPRARAVRYPQSVTVDTAVYIADRGYGGVILRYDPHTNQFTELPQYECWGFTMTELTHQLVVVGGVDRSTHETTNTLSVWSISQRRWTHHYPPLNKPRQSPAVSTYHHHLVVAGGWDGGLLATVEILDTSISHWQWLSVTGLPVSCRRMSAAITHVQGTLYLLGGTLGKQVLSVSLSALTQTDKPPPQWCTIPDAPLEDSTAIAVRGSLLTVGGSHGGQRSSAIYVYNQEKNVWNKVGDLPTERTNCACSLLPSGEILVAGGKDGNDWTSRMDEAAVAIVL